MGRRNVGGIAVPCDERRQATEQPHPRPMGAGAFVGVLREPGLDEASGQGDLGEAVGVQKAIQPPEGALFRGVGVPTGLLLLDELRDERAQGTLPGMGRRGLRHGAGPPRQGLRAARSRCRPSYRVAWRPTSDDPRSPRWSPAGCQSLTGGSPWYGGAYAAPAALRVVTQSARADGRR